MSTRATYDVAGTVFYCHCDGYHEGAAWRFAQMIENMTVAETDTDRQQIWAEQQRRGGAAFAFVRGVLDAEPAWDNSHEGHGDTDFAYTLATDAEHGLTVQVGRRVGGDCNLRSRLAFDAPQPLADFVNTYGREWEAPRVCVARFDGRAQLATVAAAEQLAAIEDKIAARFADGNPNGPSHRARALAWRRATAAECEAPQLALAV